MSIYSLDPSKITYPDVTRGWWAEARWHPAFFCVMTRSGFRGGTNIDDKGKVLYLPPDAGDLALGKAMIEALAASRWVLDKPTPGHVYHSDVEFDPEFVSYIQEQKNEQEWGKAVRKPYKLASKRDVYVPMKRCDIAKKNGTITISCRAHVPSKNYGDCWGFDKPENAPYVILPDTASAAEIGAGLRLAFSRCRDLPG